MNEDPENDGICGSQPTNLNLPNFDVRLAGQQPRGAIKLSTAPMPAYFFQSLEHILTVSISHLIEILLMWVT